VNHAPRKVYILPSQPQYLSLSHSGQEAGRHHPLEAGRAGIMQATVLCIGQHPLPGIGATFQHGLDSAEWLQAISANKIIIPMRTIYRAVSIAW
jgi:hypothetical protein